VKEQDKKENARIAAADCFAEAQKARAAGDLTRAASLENTGKHIAKRGK
jgi:hypothetical protein